LKTDGGREKKRKRKLYSLIRLIRQKLSPEKNVREET